MPRVLYKGVTKKFGNITAVDNLTLEIQDGEFMVLLGPSGCGKTTALRLVAGLEEPTEGEIYIGDRDVTDVDPSKRNVAMVFQSYALYPHMSTYGNIAFPLKMMGVSKEERDRKVREAARLLNIEHLLNKRPYHLSGGEQQRVAIARALANKPSVILADEPTGDLDTKTGMEVVRILHDTSKKENATVIVVTHDDPMITERADRILHLRDGSIVGEERLRG
jgi:multiple sugar transport system ATP-binding protein